VRRSIILALLLASTSAQAIEFHILKEPLRLDITESLFASYHGDLGYLITERDNANIKHPENHFYDILNKLNVDLAWRRLRLAFRFDSAGYIDVPDGSCGPTATTPATLRNRFCNDPSSYFYLEKYSLEYTSRTFEATLGDFYVNFGRGLVLSIRKLDELGLDTTLRGVKLVYHEGNVSATLVSGFPDGWAFGSNIQKVDEATGRFAVNPHDVSLSRAVPGDVIAGGRVEYRAGDRVIVGFHETGGVQAHNETTGEHKRPDGMFMYGATIDAPRATRWLALYFEADGQTATQSDARQNGYALYGSATGFFGPATLLVEVKHYSKFQRWRSSVDGSLAEFANVVYNQPPTAERIQTELVSPIYDVSGPRVRVDWRIRPWLLAYASYAYFADRGSGDGTLQYHDPYAGLELRWNRGSSHFFPSGGYRIERCGRDVSDCNGGQTDGEFQHVGHLEWDATQVLPRGFSIETQGFVLFRHGDRVTDASGGYPNWVEGDAYLALKWTPHLVGTVGYEFSTRPSPKVNQHYVNGSVQWNITTASSLRLFVGGTRGGLKCISGICRDFPAFTGARLEVVVRL
jgi:hypothetical protein